MSRILQYDPFVKRMGWPSVPPAYAWQAEAWKRAIAILTERADLFEAETWWWKEGMLTHLLSFPNAATVPGVPVVPHVGVGVGVHVFLNLDDYERDWQEWLRSHPNAMTAETSVLNSLWHVMVADTYLAHPSVSNNPMHKIVMAEISETGVVTILLLSSLVFTRDNQGIYRPDELRLQPEWSRPLAGPHLEPFANLTAFLRAKVVTADRVTQPPEIGAAIRKAKKAGLYVANPSASVRQVTWRREYLTRTEDNGTGEKRDKHWAVQGHMRMQPYPTERVRRPIFIAGHYKGNLTAPLYLRPKVNVVQR